MDKQHILLELQDILSRSKKFSDANEPKPELPYIEDALELIEGEI
jgi:hypothetical protein